MVKNVACNVTNTLYIMHYKSIMACNAPYG